MLLNHLLTIANLINVVLPIFLPSATIDISHTTTLPPSVLNLKVRSDDCDRVERFFNPTSQDWTKQDTDKWLDSWWTDHESEMKDLDFAKVWGNQWLSNPNWCVLGGQDGTCTFDACAIARATDDDDDLQHAYYVTQSFLRFHSFMNSMHEAFQDSSIWAAFEEDKWWFSFNHHKEKSDAAVKGYIIGVGTVIGLAGAAAGLAEGVAGPAGGAVAALGGAGVASFLTFKKLKDTTFQDAANFGVDLGTFFLAFTEELIEINDDLLLGKTIGDGDNKQDIRKSLSGGFWLEYDSFDQARAIKNLGDILMANAINQLWRANDDYIIMGPKCLGSDFSSGPFDHERVYCVNGRAVKLQRWDFSEDNSNGPHGADLLAAGTYEDITIEKVLKGSLKANEWGGVWYDYSGKSRPKSIREQRFEEALANGIDPTVYGEDWVGSFSIFVCDNGGRDSAVDERDYAWIGLRRAACLNCAPIPDIDVEQIC